MRSFLRFASDIFSLWIWKRRENLLKEREEGRTSLTRDKIYPRVCLRFFRPRLKITFSPIKCGYSFTGSLLASLRAKREFTMHVKYSSVTLLCIPFPFVSLRYFAYIYTHTRTFTLLLLHSFLATGLPLSSVFIHSLTIFFKSLAFTRIRIFKIS